jgi:4'-phosphopantetheinyl transferase
VSSVPRLGQDLRGQLHVWLARPEDFGDDRVLARFRSWLSEDERARADRYRNSEDRRLFLVAHALLRRALSQHDDVPPEGWIFANDEHGRPHVSGGDPARTFGFSLSHTSGLAACLVSDEIDCGVDVEAVGRVADPRALARRYFSATESAALDATDEAGVARAFVQLWTLKEAWLKARGLGLQLPLESASFRVDEHGSIHVAFDAATDDCPDDWQFVQFPVDSTHLLSIAVRRGEAGDRVVVRHDLGSDPERVI